MADTPMWKVLREKQVTADSLLRWAGEIAPPVDVERLIRALGISLKKVPRPGWYGAVAFDDAEATIWVKREDAKVRQRFTMAHELGHLMLHPSGVAYRDDTFAGSAQEREANQFAADLLMPAWMLGPLALKFKGSVPVLAALFDVSQEAMRYRLRNLRL